MSIKVARYARAAFSVGQMPPSLRRASSGRKRSRLLQRATRGVKRRASVPEGLAGVAPSVLTFLRGRGGARDPSVGHYNFLPPERPSGVRRRSYGVPSVQAIAGDTGSRRSSPTALVQAAARTMDRSRSNQVNDFAQPRQFTAMSDETDTRQSLPSQQPERRSTVVQYRSGPPRTASNQRYLAAAGLSPVARASSWMAPDWSAQQYAPAPVASGEPTSTLLNAQGDSGRRDISFRAMAVADGTGLQGPNPPTEQTDPPSHEKSMIGAIHLDGNALGQWMTRHLERTLSQPNRGPSGVDPRVIPTWGPLSAAY